MLVLCSMLSCTYYAQSNAGIIPALLIVTLLAYSCKFLHCRNSDCSSAVVLEMHACVGRDQHLCCLLFPPRHQHVCAFIILVLVSCTDLFLYFLHNVIQLVPVLFTPVQLCTFLNFQKNFVSCFISFFIVHWTKF